MLERLHETYNRPRLTYHASDFEEAEDELCATCAALDLTVLFREGIGCETRDGIRVRKGIPMGWSDEIYERAACPFCRHCVEIGDSRMSGDRREVEFWSIISLQGHEIISTIAEPLYEIKSSCETSLAPPEAIYLALVRSVKPPPGYGFEYRTLFKDLIYVGLLGDEHLVPPRAFSLRDIGDAATTVKIIRGWIERCNGHRTCRVEETSTSSFPDGFRLFDITALQVVNAKGQEPYIALSYPWAQVDSFDTIKRGEPYAANELPKVLKDIISVLQGLDLGIKYIWMDQLCVDQEDPHQKRLNIEAMATIYGAAFATLVLAVPPEDRPQQGLFGFSIPRRPYRHIETVGNLKLATTFPSMDMAIMTSLWNSRAWTFQEGILSRRCIIFGPDQVYFDCEEMTCCESIRELRLTTTEHDLPIIHESRLRNPFLGSYDFNELYWRLVRDYTGRDATFASDALNAFSAFTITFDRDGHKLSWGMPTSKISQSLLWEHEPWDFRDIQRRTEFPSWSWAGWSGTAAMNLPFDMSSQADFVCEVAIEASDGRVLRCKARTAQVGIPGQGPIRSIAGASQSSVVLDCGMDAGPDIFPQFCTMMEVLRIDDVTHGLLLKRIGEAYERFGSGFAKFSNLETAQFEVQELMLI